MSVKKRKKTNYWKNRKIDMAQKRNNFGKPYKQNEDSFWDDIPVTSILKKVFRMALIAGVLFLLYFGISKLIDYVCALEIISIKDIEVVGTQNISQSEIKNLLPFQIGENIFTADLSDLEDEIKQVKPEIKRISINRKLFDGGLSKITVSIEERIPQAFIKTANGLKGIDFDNKQFPLRGDMKNMKMPVISYKNDKEIALILDFLETIKPSSEDLFDSIREVRIIDADDIAFTDDRGTFIYWGAVNDEKISDKLKIFNKIYADAKNKYDKIDYIDMTFYITGRAIIKPQNKKD
ncbi:MAG: FtsQ-type POTRA domain-containing protein [Elusimicrobiota bacterium]|jgi:cell division protein FtsQ|nr:FtsQ-type POTRA domain-containing protein [Elusimicrobiota bacterium]